VHVGPRKIPRKCPFARLLEAHWRINPVLLHARVLRSSVGCGRPFLPMDAAAAANALSGASGDIDAMMYHNWPGRSARTPDWQVHRHALASFIYKAIRDVHELVQGFSVQQNPYKVPRDRYVLP
jgi:hypothetical protein